MRRWISLALTLALCLSLAACGGQDGSPADSPDITQPAQSGAPEATDPAGEPAPSGELEDSGQASPAPSAAVQPESEPVLTLNSTDFTMESAGATWRLKYTCRPDIDAVAEFSSSDEGVATVAPDGTVTAVAPGRATITLSYGDLTAQCIVRCRWTETSPAPSPSQSSAPEETPTSGNVDLAAFYTSVTAAHSFNSMIAQAGTELIDGYLAGLTDISTEQCLVYLNMMSMNMGEITLVQVSDSKDVSAVKAILQARVDYMVGDGNGPGGAWYPAPTEMWTNNSRVVSNGNYIMMVVHEDCDTIVSEFNALF